MSRFLVTADWHLRQDRPRCRLDEDWLAFQEGIVEFIVETANNYSVPIMIIGDIFDTPNVPSSIMTMLINTLSKTKGNAIQFLSGNHDLPYHSIENIDSSAVGILKSIASKHPVIHHGMTCGRWSDFDGEEKGMTTTGLVFTHRLVFENSKTIPPNVKAITAADLLEEYPKAKWIFTGDMHRAFHYEKNGRHVVNPGCISRQAADYISYQPIIYSVDTDKGLVEAIPLPDDGLMVTDSYIKDANEREDRIGAFVEGVKKNGKVSLSFLDNLEEALLKNKKLGKDTVKMIRELVEE